jgi:ribosomal protein S12 methylthiotransferase accessory factor
VTTIAPQRSKLALPGTHRSVDFSETIAMAEMVAPSLGITRVADITGLDHIGIPVVLAVRPGSRGLSVSQGKGLTLDAARASALMESIEFHHAEHVALPLRLASRRELGRGVLDRLDECAPALNSRFHADLRIPWIEADALDGSGTSMIPYELVDLDFVVPCPYIDGCFDKVSSGLASGNTFGEAVVHGLCELIERDAQALWSLESIEVRASTRVDLATVDCPENRGLLDLLDAADVTVGVWDMTTDVGVAAYTAVMADRDHRGLRRHPPTAGFGCHLDPSIALSRAITEAAQSRATFMAGTRDDIARRDYARHRDRANLSASAAMLEDVAGPVRFGDAPGLSQPTFEADLEVLLAALAGVGVGPPVVVDLTRPEVGIPVVKVVAPGLEPERDPLTVSAAPLGRRGRSVVERRTR